jgi:hypothetical protein
MLATLATSEVYCPSMPDIDSLRYACFSESG